MHPLERPQPIAKRFPFLVLRANQASALKRRHQAAAHLDDLPTAHCLAVSGEKETVATTASTVSSIVTATSSGVPTKRTDAAMPSPAVASSRRVLPLPNC